MSLYNNIDPTSVAMFGTYSETYQSATEQKNINSEFQSLGLYDTPASVTKIAADELGGKYKAKTGTVPW